VPMTGAKSPMPTLRLAKPIGVAQHIRDVLSKVRLRSCILSIAQLTASWRSVGNHQPRFGVPAYTGCGIWSEKLLVIILRGGCPSKKILLMGQPSSSQRFQLNNPDDCIALRVGNQSPR